MSPPDYGPCLPDAFVRSIVLGPCYHSADDSACLPAERPPFSQACFSEGGVVLGCGRLPSCHPVFLNPAG